MIGFGVVALSSIVLTAILRIAYVIRNKYSQKKLANLILVLGYLLYIVLAVFRKIDVGYGGDDAPFYRLFFLEKANTDFFSYYNWAREELGYVCLNWATRQLFCDYRVFLFIVHSIGYVCIAFFVENIKLKYESLTSFLGTYLIVVNLFLMFHILRSAIAISFACVFFIMVERKQNLKAMFFLLLAVMFHNSAIGLLIVFFPIILTRLIRINLRQFVKCYVLIGYICEVILLDYLVPLLFPDYVAAYDNRAGIAKGIFCGLIIIYIFLYKSRKNGEIYNDVKYDYALLAPVILFLPLDMRFSASYRVLLLFMPLVDKVMMQLLEHSICLRNSARVCRKDIVLSGLCLCWIIYESIDSFIGVIPNAVGNYFFDVIF